jgi:peptidoglycan/xylan/chitin deacetylase (PgdA/CDA1 family)
VSEGGRPGALVLSLDFELWWGLRERSLRPGDQTSRLQGARRVVPRLLELFDEFQVAATWATVGFLFAESRAELERFLPPIRPRYADGRLSPYDDLADPARGDDALRFAADLVRGIQRTPRQEIATHTFSHYYCHEPGQDRDAFRADIAAACQVAAARGVRLRSIVFPRNQHNPDYDDILLDAGIRAYRGNPRTKRWEFAGAEESRNAWKRVGRLAEAYVGGGESDTVAWEDVPQPSGLSDVRASGVLRPYRAALKHLEGVRMGRIRRSLGHAARTGRLLHLWWHPHNFGVHTEENLTFLRGVLHEFSECRDRWGMASLSMAEVHDRAASRADAAPSGRESQRAAVSRALP